MQTAAASWNWLNRARLATGMVLFAFLATHMLNHSLGLIGLEAAEAGRHVFLAVWRNWLGTVLLYGAVAAHAALAVVALLRRRSLRHVRPAEVLQLVFGFAIPPLVVYHVVANRGLHEAFGIEDTYAYVVLALWQQQPLLGVQQAVVLLVAWVHGCIGLHFWLRLRPGYGRWLPYAYAAAVLLPVLALTGFAAAGREAAILVRDPVWAAAFVERVGTPPPGAADWALALRDAAYRGMVVVLLLTGAGWLLLRWWDRRRGLVTLSYPSGRRVRVRTGTSVLEASRLHGIPHASVCGGRGRCSTCRVRVGTGREWLPAPSEEELKVLARVGAPEGVRLACQLHPTHDLAVTPLLPATAPPREAFRRPAYLQGSEREIAILFADLRAFTQFAEHKLPFDVVFVVNQYFRFMGQAVEQAGGQLDKFIGDGVMALFGLHTNSTQGCRDALAAARAMAQALDDLNRALEHEIDEPLRIGIGVHAGTVIVGEMGYAQAMSITAIGDAVNIASRLETMTKDFAVQLVVSRRVAKRAGVDLRRFARREIQVRGRREPMAVYLVPSALDLPEGLRTGSPVTAPPPTDPGPPADSTAGTASTPV